MKSTSKIVAGLLSFAMVLTLVVGFAVSQADAQTVSFTRNLTVGSKGADVTELQTILAEKGFLSVEPTGYFGSLTKAAVTAWQASVGLPNTGYFGAMSRAAIGGSSTGGTVATPGCPAGAKFNTQTGAPCAGSTIPGCAAGALFSSITGASCTSSTGGTLDNTDGSLTAAASTVVGSSVTIKKGETKDLIATQLTATAGKVAVNRFDVQFSERPWLVFTKFELVDNTTGNVLATKNVSGAADFTEVAVGTNYLLRFENLNNIVVTPGQSQILKVRGTLMASSDKITGQTVTVTLPTNGIRTTNGKGFTESLGTGATAAVTLASTGSNANLVIRAASSNVARIVTTSTNGQTNGVVLGVFDVKSENQPSTLNTLRITLNNSSYGATSSDKLFKSIMLTDGTNTYYADAIATTTTFSNLNISLPQDSYKSLTIKADVADQDEFQAGMIASTTLTAQVTTGATVSGVVGIDANYNAVTANAGNTASGGEITLLAAGVSMTSPSVTVTPVDNGSSAVVKYSVKFNFTLANTGSNDIYVSKTIADALTLASTTRTASLDLVNASGNTGQDTATYWVISAGSSRTFTYDGVMDNTGGTSGTKKLEITAIKFSDVTTNLTKSSLTFGLDALRATAAF